MKRITIILCLFALFTACRKNNNDRIKFPAETQSGLNTFGCYIDDKAFIPSTTLFGNVQPITVNYISDTTHFYKAGHLSIQGIDARYAGSVTMIKLQVFGTGEYSLGHGFNCANPYECDGGGFYHQSEAKSYLIESGKLTITRLDTLNKIISGRFYFTSKDTLGNRKDVKSGVFDTRYF